MFSFTSVLPSEGDENTDQVETYTHAHGSKENKTMQGRPEIHFAGWACKSAEGQMVFVCLAVRGKVDDGQRRWGRGRGGWEQKAGREPPLCRDHRERDTTQLASYCSTTQLTRWSLLSKLFNRYKDYQLSTRRQKLSPSWDLLDQDLTQSDIGYQSTRTWNRSTFRDQHSFAELTSDTIWHGVPQSDMARQSDAQLSPAIGQGWLIGLDDSWETGSMRKIWITDFWRKILKILDHRFLTEDLKDFGSQIFDRRVGRGLLCNCNVYSDLIKRKRKLNDHWPDRRLISVSGQWFVDNFVEWSTIINDK